MHTQFFAGLLGGAVLAAAQPFSLDLTTVPTSITPQSLVAGDFNHDGKPDLAVSSSEGLVAILLGNGDGTFHADQTIQVTAPATRILKADFNKDGNPDLAVSVGNSGQIVVLLGKADGTFQSPVDSGMVAPTGNFTPGNNPLVMVGDINGDGKIDLIAGPFSMASASVSIASSSTMYVLLGKGDGTFQVPVISNVDPVAYSETAAVDLYHDGKIEIFEVGTHPSLPQTRLLTGGPDGKLTETKIPANLTFLDQFNHLAVGDINGNGKSDVVMVEPCNPLGGTVDSYLDGSLSPVISSVPDLCSPHGPVTGDAQVALSDVDGDGKLDLLISYGSGDLYIMSGNGDGTFSSRAPNQPFYTGATLSFLTGFFDPYGSLTTADFRGTGKQDVVMALAGKSVVVLKNSAGIPPSVAASGVVSSASLTAVPLVAGSLTSIFGVGLTYGTGSRQNVDYINALTNQLFGTSVTVNGIPAPFLWISPAQANIQIPWEISGASQATVIFRRNALASQPITVPLAAQAPGLFTMNGEGSGQATAIIAGTMAVPATGPVGSFAASRPVHPGEYVAFYATGLGAVVQPVPIGTAEATPLHLSAFDPKTLIYFPTIQQTTATVGGVPAMVQFSGLAPGLIGVYQVNVLIPTNAPTGSAVPVIVSIGGVASNTVTIAIGAA